MSLQANRRPCTDVENNPHKCPFQRTKRLHHRLKVIFFCLVFHLPPSRELSKKKEGFTNSAAQCPTVKRRNLPHYQPFYRPPGSRAKQLRKNKPTATPF